MDKTFAETQGKKPFDWDLFLDRAIEGKLEIQEWGYAVERAEFWTTCACGNQCAIIPRGVNLDEPTRNGAPLDFKLNVLGHTFYRHITTKSFLDAKETLARIEARSAILIAEELAKLNAPTIGVRES